MGLFEKLKSGLARTAQQLVDRFDDIVRLADAPDARQRDLDGDTAEALEEILIMADVGVAASREIVAAVGRGGRRTESLRDLVKQEIVRILESPATAKAVALQPSV
ncbi:MAG: signal recognition particle receptor subunit alpha, partial [Vicinamibacterales bacterium]